MRNGRSVGPGALSAVASVVVIGAVLLGGCWPHHPDPSPSASTPSATSTPSTAPSVTPPPVPDPSPIVTPPPGGDTPGAVPDQVIMVIAGPSGGSAEVEVVWDAIGYAPDGYRVYRSEAPGGPFTPSASIDVATETTTVEAGAPSGFVQILVFAPGSFRYIEGFDAGPIYFRVTAYNAAGESLPSPVVCGSPIGAQESC